MATTPLLHTRSTSTRTALKAVILVLAAVGVYIPALDAGFVFDDLGLVTHNQLIHADDGLYRVWFTAAQPDYFPLTSSTLWLEWRLWAGLTNPAAGYHVSNIVLHAISALLIWLILGRLGIPAAFWAALIFAVHPVNVSSVAWIAERKNVLSMVFVLSALLCYLRFDDAGGRKWYALSLTAFGLALLSKTSVVMLPVVLLLLAWFKRRRLVRADVARTAPFFALALVLGLVTVFYQQQSIAGLDPRPEGLWSRLAASGWCVWFYLFSDLVPLSLATIYPRWEVDPASPVAWLPLAALFGVAAGALSYRRTWGRPVLVAGGIFVVMLLPALGLITMTYHEYSLVADHFQYLAMIAPIALVAATIAVLAARGRTTRWLATAAAVAVVASLATLTWVRAGAYQNSMAFWSRAVEENPQAWMAQNNLGAV